MALSHVPGGIEGLCHVFPFTTESGFIPSSSAPKGKGSDLTQVKHLLVGLLTWSGSHRQPAWHCQFVISAWHSQTWSAGSEKQEVLPELGKTQQCDRHGVGNRAYRCLLKTGKVSKYPGMEGEQSPGGAPYHCPISPGSCGLQASPIGYIRMRQTWYLFWIPSSSYMILGKLLSLSKSNLLMLDGHSNIHISRMNNK